jgi:hypothetical protein
MTPQLKPIGNDILVALTRTAESYESQPTFLFLLFEFSFASQMVWFSSSPTGASQSEPTGE